MEQHRDPAARLLDPRWLLARSGRAHELRTRDTHRPGGSGSPIRRPSAAAASAATASAAAAEVRRAVGPALEVRRRERQVLGEAREPAGLARLEILDLGLPDRELHRRRARAGGEEPDRRDPVLGEDLAAPPHHDVEDRAGGPGRAGIAGPGREHVLEPLSQLGVVSPVSLHGVRSRLGGWGRRGGYLGDPEEGVVAAEGGGDGGGEVRGDDEGGLQVAGGEVLAELRAREEVALAEEGHYQDLRRRRRRR